VKDGFITVRTRQIRVEKVCLMLCVASTCECMHLYASLYPPSSLQRPLANALWHSRKETGLAGLENQGATCYLNSLLQVCVYVCVLVSLCARQSLFHLPAFRRAVYGMKVDPNVTTKVMVCVCVWCGVYVCSGMCACVCVCTVLITPTECAVGNAASLLSPREERCRTDEGAHEELRMVCNVLWCS
jgi:hypothetical protein